MTEVVGVRFREVGKIYTFTPNGETYRRGDHVIADTAKGPEYGTVILGNYEICETQLEQPLKGILRRATEEDTEKVYANKAREHDALMICRKKVVERGLEMKVIASEYSFDDSRVIFFFTADGRVDFRDLVKDLAAIFHMRIELRQVGARDETKIVGGMGPCGRPLCCHSWLSDFVPVSIKMAKEQNLSLNPQKISGVCGRLMCCLINEADTYAYLNSQMPKKGDTVELADGYLGEITEVNVLKQTVRVLVILDDDEREMRDVPASETTFIAHRKKGQPSLLKRDAMAKREAALQEAKEREMKKAQGIEDDADAPKAENARARRERRRMESGAYRKDRPEASGEKPESGSTAAEVEARPQAAGVSDGASAASETAGGDQTARRRKRQPERGERKERPERADWSDKTDRSEKGERPDRQDRPRKDRPRRTDRPAGTPEGAAAENAAAPEEGGEQAARRRRRRRRPARGAGDGGNAGQGSTPTDGGTNA